MKKHMYLIWGIVALLIGILSLLRISRKPANSVSIMPTDGDMSLRLVVGSSPVPEGGSLTKSNGQIWQPMSDGSIRVQGPCGDPTCVGSWNPKTESWDGPGRPGASTPVPKKPSSSSGSSSTTKTTTPTPSPIPRALREILGPNVEVRGKACKSATSCADVKLSYDDKTGLVVKTETAAAADLKDVIYIEFVFEAKTYRILVSGGKPAGTAGQQPAAAAH